MAKKAAPPKAAAPPKPPDTPDAAKLWTERLTRADKDYKVWSDEYECDRLDKYYRGKHWTGYAEDDAKKKYTINLVFATVETQLPSLLFSRPKVTVEARPEHEETANSNTSGRATLTEHALQTKIDDPKLNFTFETTLALRNAYARFALIEVGYTADWIDNPNADKPVLKDDSSPMTDADGETVKHSTKILKPGTKESLFVKRLRPQNFRAWPGRNRLEANDWVAYAEWHHVEDVKRNKNYVNTEDLRATGRLASDVSETGDDVDREQQHSGMVKVWRIWDLRQKVRHVMADGHKKMLQEDKPFSTLPLADLKFYELDDAYYPLPPIYNWLSPQDEYNESREQQKIHRRRANRRYMREASVAKDEFEKLETGEDMVCIEVPKVNPSPIMPIPDAPLDSQNWTELAATKDDFGLISGVSGEQRGVPESPTATQANIVNIRAQMREARARTQVAEWLSKIARLMLITMRESMQLPFMVRQSVDPFSAMSDPKAVLKTAATWQEIQAEDLADLDVDVKIDVASLSPVAEEAQRNAWNVVLQLLTNPPLLMVLMTPNPAAPTEPSPLLRKTLTLNGIKSDQEIREIWRVGVIVLAQMQAMQMAATLAGKGGGAAGGMPSLTGGGGAPAIPPGLTTGAPAPGPSAAG
jgi:hypothetical protein